MASEASPLTCATLRSACLRRLSPQSSCSSDCRRRKRPFRIDVYGAHAKADVDAALERLADKLHDPLIASRMRHLEKDVYPRAAADRRPPRLPMQNASHTMLWPLWENGFSEAVMWTLLPLGFMLSMGALPKTTWMISGALHPRSWAPIQRLSPRLCTFERHDQVGSPVSDIISHVRDPLPRCKPSCYTSLTMCALDLSVTRARSWRGRMALDALLGFPPPRLADTAISATPGELWVIFARRRSLHGRILLNEDSLVEHCRTMHPHNTWHVVCRAHNLGDGPLSRTISLLRGADVLISMHGGDCINSLHMRPGRALVELVSFGFHHAPTHWLDQYYAHVAPVLRHVRVLLPPLGGQQPLRSPQREASGPRPSKARVSLHEAAWNANGTLPPAELERVVRGLIDADGMDRVVTAAAALRMATAAGTSSVYLNASWSLSGAGVLGSVGYCAITDDTNPGDCNKGDKGSWRMAQGSTELVACMEQCARCARCRFVSHSLAHGDCSWFAQCDVRRLGLHHGGETYTTVRVR